MAPDLDVAVVGAGIAGLATARALTQAGRSVQVFEAATRVGGRMRTTRQGGYLVDEGAEMIAGSGYQATWRLIRTLGLTTAELPRVASPVGVWRHDRIHHRVGHPLGLVTGAGLSGRGRLELLRFTAAANARLRSFDPDHPESTPLGLRTVQEFAADYRRELHDYLFQPLVGGFFGWRPETSAAAPLVAHLLSTRTTGNWRTYRDGMDTLARRLAEHLPVLRERLVQEVTAGIDSARIVVDGETLTARSVVLGVPAPEALRIYSNPPDDERDYLEACTYAPMLRVSYLLDQPLAPLTGERGFATLIPRVENPVLGVITVDHHKHPGRAPAGHGLISLLSNPDTTRDLIDAPDEEIVDTLAEHGEQYVPGLRAATRSTIVHRFRNGLPEATPAALQLRSAFLRRPARPVDYAGDWVMQRPCSEAAVRSAELAAPRILTLPAPALP